MKRNFIFAFILLATLLTVNAVPTELRKRVTAFQPCPDESPPLTVTKVVPDPVIGGAKVTFDISGTLPKAITAGSGLGVVFADVSTNPPKVIGTIGPKGALLICTPEGVLDCPYAAKTPFSVILDGLAPDLPKSYAIAVLLLDANAKTLGCAISLVDGAPKAPAPPPDAPAPAPAPAGTPAPAPAPAATPPPAPASPSPPPASPPPAAPSQGSGGGGIQDFKALVKMMYN